MKYKVGDILNVVDSDDIVTIRGIQRELGVYIIGNTWDYREPHRHLPKYAYAVGSAICIEEKYLEDYVQKYKVGDTVWYIDTVSTEMPRIRQDIIVETACTISTLFKLKNHYHSIKKELIHKDKLFPTKEALLAVIDPLAHNFVVGQTVWYVNNLVDRLCVQKGIFCSCEHDAVTVGIGSDYAVQTFVHIDHVFDNPQDAVTKALELKQW